jgi:hypothetical protein
MFCKERGLFLKKTNLTDEHAPNFACKVNNFWPVLLPVSLYTLISNGQLLFYFMELLFEKYAGIIDETD